MFRSESIAYPNIYKGNVIATLSDDRSGIDTDSDGKADTYNANVLSATDYFPFGMSMQGRVNSPELYRFGFNGKEKDDEINGTGATYDYGFRIYDARIGKFLSVDPLTKSYPELTPFQFASNSPIVMIDIDGLEGTPFFLLPFTMNPGFPKFTKNSVDVAKDVSENMIDGPVRVFTYFSYVIPNGYKTQFTGTQWKPWTHGFSWDKGIYNISEPFTPENERKFVSAYVGTIVSSAASNMVKGTGYLLENLTEESTDYITGKTFDIVTTSANNPNQSSPNDNNTQEFTPNFKQMGQPSNKYIINRGDTLSQIAKDNNTTVDKLQSINNIENPDLIKAGETIQLTQ